MAEIQAMTADTAAAPAVAARPRASADAFRNLTARLKQKTDAAIPALTPVVTAPAVAPPPNVDVVTLKPIEVAALPVDEVVAPVIAELAPALPIEKPAIAPQAPVLAEMDPDLPPFTGTFVKQGGAPSFEDLQPLELAPPPPPPPPAPALVEAALPELQGSFDDNFTYVPEGGKSAAPAPAPVEVAEVADVLEEAPKLAEKPVDLSGIDEAVKQQVAERAIQNELENIWRMLLAKPTSDDRVQYLREAAELMKDDDDNFAAPAPEFDLSKIAPAEEVAASFEQLAVELELGTVVSPAPVTDVLPVSEGQDLAELSRSLLDMMAAGSGSGLPHERALAADTLLRIAPRLELKPLVMLAQRLSMMDAPPNLLVARLIRDPRVEVAGPLLEDCPQITDKDLETVVQEGEPAKLRMIARRRKLTRPISDALIKSGDPSVVLTLVRNMEAEISHEGFQSLLVLAQNNDELHAPLATRSDFSAPFAFELFWLAPAQLRRFILSRFLTDSETLTKILKITMATKDGEEVEAEPMSQHAMIEALDRASRGMQDKAAEELSGILQLSEATVSRILSDLQGDALVVMLKAAGYPRSAVTGMLKKLQDAELPLISRERDVSELQTMFETLSFNKARILLTYWDWASSKTGPYAPAH